MKFDPNDPAQVEAIQKILMLRAERARTDPKAFVEFVMREQVTKRKIRVVPHQEIGLDFMRDHPKCVMVWPAGAAKTYLVVAMTLWLLGRDPTSRGAVVSKTQELASKIVAVVRDYVENSRELRLVFPHLRPMKGHWTDVAITVDRPPGIPDPSLVALGIGGSILGSRLSWAIVDDILDLENTLTPDPRKKTIDFVLSSVMSRGDPANFRMIVSNTAWHPEDLVHHLKDPLKGKWPSLRMTITGDVHVGDDPHRLATGLEPWDHPLLRPKYAKGADYACRIAREGIDDSKNDVPLFPERFLYVPWDLPDGSQLPPAKTIAEAIERAKQDVERKRREFGPVEFNRAFMAIARDDETAFCKQEWIDACKRSAREAGYLEMVSKYDGPNPTFTGVDLAIGLGEEHDSTAFFTFEVLPDRRRRILDIEIGKWKGPVIVDKMIAKHRAYRSTIRVENNQCFPPETPVLTRERGYVSISDARIGEHVWTHLGRWRPIKSVLRGTSRFLVTTNPRGSLRLRSTMNHWIWVRDAGRVSGRGNGHCVPVGEPKWVSAAFIEPRSYVEVPAAKWPERAPVLRVPANRREKSREIVVDEEIALFLGLFMAEGHTSNDQVGFTLSNREQYLIDFLKKVCARLAPTRAATQSAGDGTFRLFLSSKAIADVLRPFGKSAAKCAPLEWLGWPLDLRLAMVRGWLVGDGCLATNNGARCPSINMRGQTISRNWAMFARTTLLHAGIRATLASEKSHDGYIGERLLTSKVSFVVGICQEDVRKLARTWVPFEHERWGAIAEDTRRSNAAIVPSRGTFWTKARVERGKFEEHDAEVFNLEVEEDESFVANEIVVHNAQDFIRQQAIHQDISLPIKPHTTGRAKAHPEYGVPGGFIEMANGTWLIPNDKNGNVHPHVQQWIDGCLYYAPTKHTDDAVMAWYFAREQAKEWGFLSPPPKHGVEGLGASLLSR